DVYRKMVALDSSDEDASFRLGLIRPQASDFAQALQFFENCVGLQRKSPEVLLNIGIAHWRMNNPSAAKEAFRRVLGMDPKSADALRCLAALAIEYQDFRQALTLYMQILDAV